MTEPQYEVEVNGGRSWTTNSEFSEFDATHAVAGALLAGADQVTITRVKTDDDDDRDRLNM